MPGPPVQMDLKSVRLNRPRIFSALSNVFCGILSRLIVPGKTSLFATEMLLQRKISFNRLIAARLGLKRRFRGQAVLQTVMNTASFPFAVNATGVPRGHPGP